MKLNTHYFKREVCTNGTSNPILLALKQYLEIYRNETYTEKKVNAKETKEMIYIKNNFIEKVKLLQRNEWTVVKVEKGKDDKKRKKTIRSEDIKYRNKERVTGKNCLFALSSYLYTYFFSKWRSSVVK